MKRMQFKIKKKHAVKVAPLMMSLLLMACGGEDGGGDSSLPSDPCAPTSYTCDSDRDGYSNGEETDNGTDLNDPNDPVQNGDKDDDGDGYSNGEEVKNDTDSQDPNDPVRKGNQDSDGDGIPNGKETAEGWNDNDANNPVQMGNQDKDGDGIKNGLETVKDWDDNDANNPVENGNLDSDGDGIEDGREQAQGWDKLNPNAPVANGDEDKDGDGLPNGLETVNGWDDNDASNPISADMVQNPDLVLDNNVVIPGTTLQAAIEFGLEGSTQTYSTLKVADADHVTWSVLDSSLNPVTKLEPTSEGLVTIPATEEIISLVNQPLTMRATFVEGGWFTGQAVQDETFELKLAQVDGEASQIVTTVNGTPSHESVLEVQRGSDVTVAAEYHFEDGTHYTTASSGFVTWMVTPGSGATVDANGVVNTDGVNVTGNESANFTITATGHGPFEGVTKAVTITVKAATYPTEGVVVLPGVGSFFRPLTTAQADVRAVAYDGSYTSQFIQGPWATFYHASAEAMCAQFGYRLPTYDELEKLFKVNLNLNNDFGWPVDAGALWTSTRANMSDYYAYNPVSGIEQISSSPKMATCIRP